MRLKFFKYTNNKLHFRKGIQINEDHSTLLKSPRQFSLRSNVTEKIFDENQRDTR